jgi:hypothetical protein
VKSPEFQLLVACCRWSFAGNHVDRVHELCDEVDWGRFVRVARYHRVQALVWNCLSSTGAEVPQPAADDLAADARSIAAANLRIAIEARDLRLQFEAAKVALVFLKGLTVGKLAYDNPMLKMGWDIDLLVDPKQLCEATRLLRARGYRRILPAPQVDLRSWHRLHKESVWSRDDGLYVELHARLADQPALIPGIDVSSPAREIEVAPGIALPTFQEDELFAYLCVHGASSLWFRLKWITDFAAILHGVPNDEIERLYDQSLKLGAGRSSGSALLLADTLYGTLGNSTLGAVLRRDRTIRRLRNAALRQLAGRDEPVEPTLMFGGTAAIHYTQLLLLPGLGFKLSELVRQARAAIW